MRRPGLRGPAYRPHSGRARERPRVTALCARAWQRRAPWPGLTGSAGAASVFPTSLPQQDKRARSGSLRLGQVKAVGSGG